MMVPPNQSGLNHVVGWGRDRLTVCNVGVRSGYSAKRRRPVLVVLGRHWGPTMHLPRFLLLALLTLRTASAAAASDGAAGVRYLRSRRELDSTRVGLFGASQGGWVAPVMTDPVGRVARAVGWEAIGLACWTITT